MRLNNLLMADNIHHYKSDINNNLRSGLLFAYKRKLINKIYNDDDYEADNIDQIFLPYNSEGTADLDHYNDNDMVIAHSVRHLGEKQSEDGCLVLLVDWSDKD